MTRIARVGLIAMALTACAGRGPVSRPPAARAPDGPSAPPAPSASAIQPPLFLVDVRPGFSAAGRPRSNALPDVKSWFEGAVGGIASARFMRPISLGGRSVLTDGVAYGRISNDLVTWVPELSCGLDRENRFPPFWGRDPDVYVMQHDGFARFDSAEHRWVRVGPDAATWPSRTPAVAEAQDGRTLLVLWLPYRSVVLLGRSGATAPARPEPPRVSPGFYRLGDSLEPVVLEIRPDLENQAVIDFAVTNKGDVVLLTSAGAEIWRVGQTKSIADGLVVAQLPAPFPNEWNWLDLDGSRPEAIRRLQAGPSAISRFDGQRWSNVVVPFDGPISAWSPDGDARLYAEKTASGARIWRRAPGDRWSVIDDLPRGRVKRLARDRSGGIWAFAALDGTPGGDLWYLPKAGPRVPVHLPGHAALRVVGFSTSDSVVWVNAMANDLTMELFATRKFRYAGARVGPGDDACGGRTD